MRVHSFAPIERASARLLILGTMPGRASLSAGEYYAHPRNAFWRIVAALFSFDPAAAYAARAEALRAADVALWDVLRTCTRETSLDTDIEPATIVPNEIAAFLDRHRRIRTIAFNGLGAERLFRRYVSPTLSCDRPIDLVRLPSTSPAHAGRTFQEKLAAWREALRPTMLDKARATRI